MKADPDELSVKDVLELKSQQMLVVNKDRANSRHSTRARAREASPTPILLGLKLCQFNSNKLDGAPVWEELWLQRGSSSRSV